MNSLICPGIFNVFGSDFEVPFCSWALLLPSPPLQPHRPWWHRGYLEFLPVGPAPQSPTDGPCVPMEVSGVALAICPGGRTLAGGAGVLLSRDIQP